MRPFYTKFALCLLVIFLAQFAHSQTGIRWDLGAPGSAGAVTTASSGGLPALLAQPGVQLNWCDYPANAVPCTNFATTYTSLTLGTPCSNTTQVVLQGSSSCQTTGDNFGNLGVYTALNTTCVVACYSYTLTVNGVSYGPYTVTLGGVGGGGGGIICGGTCTAGTLPSFVTSSSVQNSSVTDSGTVLGTTDASFSFLGSGTGSIINATHIPGQSLIVNAATGNSGIGGGGFNFNAGPGATSTAGGTFQVNAGNCTNANCGNVYLFGGTSLGTGLGGTILLSPGAGPSIAKNGTVQIGSGSPAPNAFPFYPGQVTFANLGSLPQSTITAAITSASIWCRDCMGAADGAVQGSVAVGGSSIGTWIYSDGTNFRVWGGLGSSSSGGALAVSNAYATASVTAPSPVGTNTCVGNPFNWIQDAGGTYQSEESVDPSLHVSEYSTNGFLNFCRPPIFNSSGITPGGTLNGTAFNVFGTFSAPANTIQAQWQYQNSVSDSGTYSAGNINQNYAQMQFNGTPTVNSTFVSLWRGDIIDNRTGGSKPAGWSVYQAAPQKTNNSAITNCTSNLFGTNTSCYVGFSSVAQALIPTTESETGVSYTDFEGSTEDGGSGTATGATGIVFHAINNSQPLPISYGFLSEAFPSGANSWNIYSKGTSTTGQNYFGGPSTFANALNVLNFGNFTQIAAPSDPASGILLLYADSTSGLLTCLNSSGGSCLPSGISYPSGAGLAVSTGSAWGTSVSETDGDIVFGSGGAWTKGTALPNGITGTTQSAGDNSTKVATTAYADTLGALKLNIANSVPTGTFNGSGLAQLKQPIAAGFASLANGECGYDTTNKNWHCWVNGSDQLMIPLAAGFVSGNCGQPTATSSQWVDADSGAPCGTSSMVYPSAGVAVSTGSAWTTPLTAPAVAQITGTVYSGTAVMPTGALLANTCSSVVTNSASGVLTTDVVRYGFNGDPTLTSQFNPTNGNPPEIITFPTANNTNVKYCNYSSSTITLAALTLNVYVQR